MQENFWESTIFRLFFYAASKTSGGIQGQALIICVSEVIRRYKLQWDTVRIAVWETCCVKFACSWSSQITSFSSHSPTHEYQKTSLKKYSHSEEKKRHSLKSELCLNMCLSHFFNVSVNSESFDQQQFIHSLSRFRDLISSQGPDMLSQGYREVSQITPDCTVIHLNIRSTLQSHRLRFFLGSS